MNVNLGEFGERLAASWPSIGAALCVLAVLLELMRRARLQAAVRREDRRVREELERTGGWTCGFLTMEM